MDTTYDINHVCILVTGSSGYIGFNIIQYLKTVVDSNVKIIGIDKKPGPETTKCIDITNTIRLEEVFEDHHPTWIIHLAALIQVGESETEPEKYWHNNFTGTFELLKCIKKYNLNTKLVFASSAAVYSDRETLETGLTEGISQLKPSSVYGDTKLSCERLIESYCKVCSLNATCLRFFNVGGGVRIGKLRHLIPIALNCLKNDQVFNIFGNDYDTEDGTCVRDYVHVNDVAEACYKALIEMSEFLVSIPRSFRACNICTNIGTSVKQVLATIEEVTGRTLKIKEVTKRPGDPGTLIGSTLIAKSYLDWTPKCTLKDIIEDEWLSLKRCN